jgi:hypothetical protein
MIRFFKNLFRPKSTKSHSAVFGSCYGVLAGKYVGEMFVFISEEGDILHFLSIPTMKNRSVPLKKYKYAISNNVLEYIERLPKSERNVCELQFKSNRESK